MNHHGVCDANDADAWLRPLNLSLRGNEWLDDLLTWFSSCRQSRIWASVILASAVLDPDSMAVLRIGPLFGY